MTKTHTSGATRRPQHPPTSPATTVRRAARGEAALSNTHAVLLMVAVTVILAALVLLAVLSMFPAGSWAEPQPPIVITGVSHVSGETGTLTYASRVTLKNNGSTTYENDCLKAVFYKDGQKVRVVWTLNGHLLISSHHYGVRYLSGEGCRSPFWNPGEEMIVDLSDETLYPGAEVTLEVVDKRNDKVISKHTVRA